MVSSNQQQAEDRQGRSKRLVNSNISGQKFDHVRLYSKATTASPTSDYSTECTDVSQEWNGIIKQNVPAHAKALAKRARQPVRRVGTTGRADISKRRSVRNDTRIQPLATRTPARPFQIKPHHMKSPGGTDYLVTPGHHRIYMTEFLASFDCNAAHLACPAVKGQANYAEAMFGNWRRLERSIDDEVYMLSYPDTTATEHVRRMAVQHIFNYAIREKLQDKTVHTAVLNVYRLLHHEISRGVPLTENAFACMVMAALRNAVKIEEPVEQSDKFRSDPNHIWGVSSFCENMKINNRLDAINQLETHCLQVLDYPLNPPVAPDFLDRYLHVGAWPENVEAYRELAQFMLGMCLFAHGSANPLRGTCPSRLAAAALVLAIKVINTDSQVTYQFWPERLELYTSYSFEDLGPTIRGISMLLRAPPINDGALERFYPTWGGYEWS